MGPIERDSVVPYGGPPAPSQPFKHSEAAHRCDLEVCGLRQDTKRDVCPRGRAFAVGTPIVRGSGPPFSRKLILLGPASEPRDQPNAEPGLSSVLGGSPDQPDGQDGSNQPSLGQATCKRLRVFF